MKPLFLTAVLLGSAAMAVSQTDHIGSHRIQMTALQISSDHGVRQLRGRVRIETTGFVLTADRATFDPKSRDIYARGNVHVTLK